MFCICDMAPWKDINSNKVPDYLKHRPQHAIFRASGPINSSDCTHLRASYLFYLQSLHLHSLQIVVVVQYSHHKTLSSSGLYMHGLSLKFVGSVCLAALVPRGGDSRPAHCPPSATYNMQLAIGSTSLVVDFEEDFLLATRVPHSPIPLTIGNT